MLVLYSSYISVHTYTINIRLCISSLMVSTPVSGTLLAFLLSPGAPVHGLISYSIYHACNTKEALVFS